MTTDTKSEIKADIGLTGRELPPTLVPLRDLSWNYWWSWAPDAVEVFRDLDPGLWAQCAQNPRLFLTQISDLRLAEIAANPLFAERVQQLQRRFDTYMSDSKPWPKLPLRAAITRQNPVAYFCAEFGVHNSLPLYSGGLGILAGDHLKSASDLNLPLVAVGLFYRFGYFRQRMSRDDWQEEEYRENHVDELALQSVDDEQGKPLLIDVVMRGRTVSARVWRADVGRVQLYLLDTNVAENSEVDRLVTGHLYGGDRETRLVQEMMLGIGGVRLLQRLNIEPSVFHLNEGHSAFLTLELAREIIAGEQVDFRTAARWVRERCVFTTHTPVAAGHDEFEASLVQKGFGDWPENNLGLSREEFLALGRVNGDSAGGFGPTPLALRMSRSTNGVSCKHGEVSRALWQKLWPEKNVAQVPITSVTNGVHPATWVAAPMRALFEKYIGEDWLEKTYRVDDWSAGINKIADEELWQAHRFLKQRLVAFVRQNLIQTSRAGGDGDNQANLILDPEALTIGFARRVAGYKRWDLLLSDRERLVRLINDSARPVQFVFAGKAHPHDQDAKLILQNLVQWLRDTAVRHHVAFIEDYDQEVARQLVQSVDVWMNVPRRPQEASGTSGQKAAVNGGLNFSVLDGWWLEGFDGTNGFAIGDLSEAGKDADADRQDAESLYRTLEEEIIPRFYDRDQNGIPRPWVAMMKRAIQTLVPAFSSDRMVADYVELIYGQEADRDQSSSVH